VTFLKGLDIVSQIDYFLRISNKTNMYRIFAPQGPLIDIVGPEPMAIAKINRAVFEYIRINNLNSQKSHEVTCDDKLKEITELDVISTFKIVQCVMQHVISTGVNDEEMKAESDKKRAARPPRKITIKGQQILDLKSEIRRLQGVIQVLQTDAPEPVVLCIVCRDEPRTHTFRPCGHFACCEDCSDEFLGTDCPICRQIVYDAERTYIV
jgi:hypothetical protein